MFHSLIVFREYIFGHVVTESFLANFCVCSVKIYKQKLVAGLETVTETFLCPSQSFDKGSYCFCTYQIVLKLVRKLDNFCCD